MLIVYIRNDGTGTREVGNYEVLVTVNGQVVDRARVEGHERAQDWRALLARLVGPDAILTSGADGR